MSILSCQRLAVVFLSLVIVNVSAIAAPSIGFLTPGSGLTSGGATVTILGSGFDESGTTIVLFDGVPATNVAVLSGGEYYAGDEVLITCVIPAHAVGFVNVEVINPDLSSTTGVSAFEYVNPGADTTPPIVTLLDANPVIHPLNVAYSDAGATALDAVDGVVATFNGGINVNVGTEGFYSVFWFALDSSSNLGQAVRSIIVDSPVPVMGSIDGTGGSLGRTGVDLSVPSGALPGATPISIDRVTVPGGVTLPPSVSEVVDGTVFEVTGLESLTAGSTVTIVIEYPDADNDGIVDGTTINELDLEPFVIDSATLATQLVTPFTIDPVANTITFDIDAELFGVGGKIGSSLLVSLAGSSGAPAAVPLALLPLLLGVFLVGVAYMVNGGRNRISNQE